MSGVEVLQTRVPAEVAVRMDEVRGEQSRADWLRALVAAAVDSGEPVTVAVPAAAPMGPRSIGPGIPAPGVACAWPSCWDRSGGRYGVIDPAELTRGGYRDRPRDEDRCGIVLCKAHAALLEGREYRRPAAARAGRLGRPAA